MAEYDRRVPAREYTRDAVTVARHLLGKRLISKVGGVVTGGVIVETEAYLHRNDPACHGAKGKLPKNRTMFGPAGRAYVYSIHARYCFNVVAQEPGEPAAVLIRAVRPLVGLETMVARRGCKKPLDLARGPARLCEALAIDRSHDGLDLSESDELWISEPTDGPERPIADAEIKTTARIGVTSAKRRKLRFVLRGCEYASGPKYMRN